MDVCSVLLNSLLSDLELSGIPIHILILLKSGLIFHMSLCNVSMFLQRQPLKLHPYITYIQVRCLSVMRSFSKYSGSGAVNSTYLPVVGWINPMIMACSVCPVRLNSHFSGP